ncbi:MAG TPA: hypothetical protein PLS46_00360 [Microthrixaceae bacterium]|nr:hypothetical protein [Microthrixaceae bacterium]
MADRTPRQQQTADIEEWIAGRGSTIVAGLLLALAVTGILSMVGVL